MRRHPIPPWARFVGLMLLGSFVTLFLLIVCLPYEAYKWMRAFPEGVRIVYADFKRKYP